MLALPKEGDGEGEGDAGLERDGEAAPGCRLLLAPSMAVSREASELRATPDDEKDEKYISYASKKVPKGKGEYKEEKVA